MHTGSYSHLWRLNDNSTQAMRSLISFAYVFLVFDDLNLLVGRRNYGIFNLLWSVEAAQ